MRRVGVLALGLSILGCAGIPTDRDAREQLEGQLDAFGALCAQVASQPQRNLTLDDPTLPAPLADAMRSLGVSAARQDHHDWPTDGVLLEIHVSGLAVSGSASGLWCGPLPPGELVADSREAMVGKAHGFACAPLRPGWFVCREWT